MTVLQAGLCFTRHKPQPDGAAVAFAVVLMTPLSSHPKLDKINCGRLSKFFDV
jgi:hypothetical protein